MKRSPASRSMLVGLFGFILACACSGCWNYHELDELSIVSGVGIDKGQQPGTVQLTMQIIKPGEVKSGGGGGSPGGGAEGSQGAPVVVKSSSGKTVFEAIRNFLADTNRKLYFPHNQVIIIGKEQARQGVRPILDLFIRDQEPRPTVWILVADGKASDVLKVPGQLEKISAVEISDLEKAQSALSENVTVNLQDFVSRLMSKTTAPIAAIIKTDDRNQPKRNRLTGTAVFKKDRLVGKLDGRQTRGLLWILGKVKSGIISIRVPDGEAGMEIIRSSSQIRPVVKNGHVKMQVFVREDGNLGCQMTPVDLTKPEMLKSLARRKATVIRNEIQAALTEAKALKADIFGFGEAIHRSNPKEWAKIKGKWDQLFPELQVEIDVRSRVRLVGLITKPAVPPQE